MTLTRVLLMATFVLGTVFATTSPPVNAALPCNLLPHIDSTEFSDEVQGEIRVQSMRETLEGYAPANRTGAAKMTDDDPGAQPFNVISAAGNILRCLDYGQDEVLVVNSTPRFRFGQFGVHNDIPEVALINDLDASGVYTERVENPLKLRSGNYLVDFTARHNGLWLSGEMVFELYEDDLYLNATYLSDVQAADGEHHRIETTDEGISTPQIAVKNGDSIGFGNEREESIRIHVTSNDTGETVFEGGNLGKGFAGGAPKNVFFVRDLEPGVYTGTIRTDGGEVFEVQIMVEP